MEEITLDKVSDKSLQESAEEEKQGPRVHLRNDGAYERKRRRAGGVYSALCICLFLIFALVVCIKAVDYFTDDKLDKAAAFSEFWHGENGLNFNFSAFLIKEAYPGIMLKNSENIGNSALKPPSDIIQTPNADNGDNTTNKNEDENKEPVEGGGDKSIYDYDYSSVPSGATPILPYDLSLSEYGITYIHNDTSYSPNIAKLLGDAPQLPAFAEGGREPLVLIVHTHGTEAYSDFGAGYYYDNGGELARSKDISQNVVSVGAVMARVLNQNGVPTLHCEIMHDAESYRDSYRRSAETIRKYLSEYPSIKYVFDVHRDSIVKSSGELVRAVADLDGEAVAQVMFVVGSDEGGANYNTWENNLTLSLELRERLLDVGEKLTRPTLLRPSSYNQECAAVSLLIEVGSSGNSLDEAKAAAKLVATALANIIKEG